MLLKNCTFNFFTAVELLLENSGYFIEEMLGSVDGDPSSGHETCLGIVVSFAITMFQLGYLFGSELKKKKVNMVFLWYYVLKHDVVEILKLTV